MEPGIDKKEEHVAVLNIPEDIRGDFIAARFVEKNDVLAAALAFALELHGQVPGGAQPVDAAADHDVGDRFG